MKVLIADDSAFMRAILKDIVAKSDWAASEVLEAGDGEETLQKIESEKPDLVLLDIIMPKKDGMAVLKEIGHTSLAVVIVSSVGQEQIVAEAKELGAKAYVIKPFDIKQVTDAINSIFPQKNA